MALAVCAAVLAGCRTPEPAPVPDPEGTIYYTESNEIFPNPERGFLAQIYYKSDNTQTSAQVAVIQGNRKADNLTLYLDS